MGELPRRAVILGALALPLLPRGAFALTPGGAEALVGQVVGEINAVINSGRPEAAMLREFEGIFARWADVPTIARSVLGPVARSASQAQMNAFAEAFRGYIARKYGRRFREFAGGRVVVQDARPVQSFVEVRSVADLPGQASFAVSFLVSDRSGQPRFFDMLIEGISLLRTEQSEIGAMLDRRRGNIDALIQDLRTAG